jgi:hypothetical protein
MNSGYSSQYHFSQEQRAQLGQVYRLILSWKQEDFVVETKEVGHNESSQTSSTNGHHRLEDDAEKCEA